MGVLDQVTLMRNRGQSDQEIINSLKDQGIPPKMIQDAMAQAQIKEAVARPLTDGMQQSIMGTEEDPEEFQGAVAPQPEFSGIYSPQEMQQEQYQEYAPQEYGQQEYYQQEGYAYAASDTGTLIEIAEQVFSDKIKKIQKQVDNLNEFKTLSDARLSNVEERLKRIEMTIDKLQLSILDKVGSYGEGIDSIKNEMSMMQDSFSKVINPFLDKTEKHRRR